MTSSLLLRRILAFVFLTGLSASLASALPSGTQTILPPAFTDTGSNIESVDFTISGTHALEIGPAGNGQGAYLNSSASSGSITVAAKSGVASFELSGIAFDEWEAADNFTIAVVGTKTDNTTISSATIFGTTGNDTYTLSLSSFSGVQLKSFEVQVTNSGRQILNFSLVSFTVANAQAPDTTPPTVTGVTSSTANGAYNAGDTVSIQVGFSENVTVTGTPQLTLETGATDRTATYASGSGGSTLTFTYTVQADDTSADLDYVSASALALNGGTIRDAASNNATLTLASPGAANSLGANKALIIDTTVPSVSVGSPSASLTRSGPVTYTVTYSDTNFSASTLATGNITLNTTGTASATLGVSGSGSTRTVTLSSIAGDGTLGISIAFGTASDTAGNLAPAAGPSTTFTVDNTAPSITSTLSASGTYDNVLSTYTITAAGSPATYSASGLPSGLSLDTGNGQITGTPLATGNFNVTIGATDAAGNLGTATLALSIAQKALTVSGVTASNKTYDGGTSATLGFGSASLAGVRLGDTVNLATGSASGVFADENVGAVKTVIVSGLALSGASSANYALTQPTTTADITAAGLTVIGVTASNKTYDGNTSATLGLGSAALSGVVGGDDVTLVTGSAAGAFADENVETGKTVAVSGLTLGGSDSGNYTLTQPTTTASITAAALTVTGVTASNKTYDGTVSATLNLGSAALSGVVGGDTVTLDTGSANGVFDNENVGTGKTVSVSGLTLSGTDSGNYSLTQPTTTADITAATLTVTADDKTRAYGFANPTLTASITGFVNSETSAVLSGAPALSTSANAASTPGAYSITAAIGTLSAGNYTFAFADGTLTVRLQEIADWEEENFTLEELGNPLVSGPDADPDLDGVTNLYEYAFGTDPNDIASGPDPLVYTGTFAGGGTLVETGKPISRVEVSGSGTATRVLFIRRVSAYTSDLDYTVQFTSNNTTWTSSSATPTVLATDGLVEVVAVPYQLITSGKKTRAFRVLAETVE